MQLPIQAQSTIFVEPWEATATTADLVAVAQAADRAGALYVGVCEHVAIPKPFDEKMGTTWYHPFVTLGFLAAATERVRLLSHVIALPYHHPLEVAKAFGTLDALSGGRAIAGVGAGHVEPEFALLGVDFAGRGDWVERSLPAIRAALDDEYPALPDGDWGLDGSAGLAPRPAQASVPIWVGGSSPVAVRRAAQYGDGWLPQGVKRSDLPGVVERIRRLRAEAGRPEAFDVGALVAATSAPRRGRWGRSRTRAGPTRSPTSCGRGSTPAPTRSRCGSTRGTGPSWSTRSSASAPRSPRCCRADRGTSAGTVRSARGLVVRRRRGPGSAGFVAPEGDALDDPVLVAEVADHRVLGGAVVPEADVARAPVVAHGVLGLDRVVVQELRAGRRSRAGSSSAMCDVKPGFTNSDARAGLGVGAHDGVLDRLERRERLALPARPRRRGRGCP